MSVLEGSPPASAETSAEVPAVTPPVEPTDEVTTTERTPEEVETIWKNRVAGKDRAHSAETATLRAQIAERDRKLEDKRQVEEGEMTDLEREKARADAAEARATQAEQDRIRDVRQAKYGAAAEALDETALVSMDEAKLAALNARLQGDEAPEPPVIDPNTAPRRSSAPPATPRDKPVDELESDLKKYESEFQNSLGG